MKTENSTHKNVKSESQKAAKAARREEKLAHDAKVKETLKSVFAMEEEVLGAIWELLEASNGPVELSDGQSMTVNVLEPPFENNDGTFELVFHVGLPLPEPADLEVAGLSFSIQCVAVGGKPRATVRKWLASE